MFRRIGLTVFLFIALSLFPGVASAAPTTVETAQGLDAAHSVVTDILNGDSGGAFRYYAIDYPGGAIPVPMFMRAQPGRGTAGVGTGFKVYGPLGLVGEAIGDDRSTSDSSYGFTLTNTTRGRYYVQVYNFIQGLPMNFQFRISGLPAEPTPIPQPAPAPVSPPPPTVEGDTGQPVTPAPIIVIPPVVVAPALTALPLNDTADRAYVLSQTTSTTGSILAGRPTGGFNYYWLDYPGGRQKMTITVGYSPLAFNSDKAVGFKLYRSDNTVKEGSVIAGESAQTGRNESSATAGFTLEADGAERYLLQVFNYLDGTTINYTLIVEGLAGPVADVGEISSPNQAFVLSLSQSAARGTLTGDKGGKFHFFLLQYPGSDREVKITVTSEPNGELFDGQFGFHLWRGSQDAGIGNAGVDDKRRRSATVLIKESNANTFGIQVFNYSPGAVVRYVITVTGL